MSFTRRLPERARAVAAALSSVTIVACAAVSCSDEERLPEILEEPDAAFEASPPPSGDAETPKKDGAGDASPWLDAARSDAAPLPVVCEASTCATALTTTIDGEGFCALLRDKSVACWGQNSNAELGRGDVGALLDSATPARVADLVDAVAIDHTCAIDASGAVLCWGKGPFMRGGAVATTIERTPVKLELPPVTKIAVAAQTGCAVSADGVRCWGSNVNGQIAPIAPTANPSTALPAQVVAIPGGKVVDLVAGNASFAIRADGSLVSWGGNPPLGRVSSISPDPYPAQLSLDGVSVVAAAADNACVVASGIAFCWGSPLNTYIITPLEPLPERKLPEPVVTPEALVHIATTRSVAAQATLGIPAIPQRACAVSVTGKVYCWGANGSGQAGSGTTSYAYSPVLVDGLPGPVARVSTTPKATCALLTSGAIHCWGDGFNGQLGRGRLGPPSLVPQEVLLP